jgi:hypothetical protein
MLMTSPSRAVESADWIVAAHPSPSPTHSVREALAPAGAMTTIPVTTAMTIGRYGLLIVNPSNPRWALSCRASSSGPLSNRYRTATHPAHAAESRRAAADAATAVTV